MLTNQEIAEDLVRQFGEDGITNPVEHYGILNVETTADRIIAVVEYLHRHPRFKFNFLTDMAGIHFPDAKGKELGMIYHLHSWENNVRVMVKVFVPIENPVLPTLVNVFACANWMEREAYDFFGFHFEGHPNLIRILNVEEMDYFPMRKEYPLEDATRKDKIDELFGR
jgi:NADH-quinone oxidoreductase subunit C